VVELLETFAQRLAGPEAIQLQLELAGAEGRWWIALDGPRLERGEAPAAAFSIAVHLEDLRDLIEGAATLRACLIDGRVRIEGDLGAAMTVLSRL
jgi:putative sterol carrier protein